MCSADRTTVGGFVSFHRRHVAGHCPAQAPDERERASAARACRCGKRIRLIDEKPEDDLGRIELQRARGDIRMVGLSYKYPAAERAALSDVSLEIRAGETLALVGQSGSGKTTLANLVPRFYHPTAGRILVDGHDIETIRLSSLRANVGLVSQDVTLFNDTIAANIAMAAKPVPPKTKSSPPRRALTPGTSSRSCRKVSARWSARMASSFPVASDNAWRSRARCSRTRRS
jgi:subfamily B ATP-binding cassette protein MsbA